MYEWFFIGLTYSRQTSTIPKYKTNDTIKNKTAIDDLLSPCLKDKINQLNIFTISRYKWNPVSLHSIIPVQLSIDRKFDLKKIIWSELFSSKPKFHVSFINLATVILNFSSKRYLSIDLHRLWDTKLNRKICLDKINDIKHQLETFNLTKKFLWRISIFFSLFFFPDFCQSKCYMSKMRKRIVLL